MSATKTNLNTLFNPKSIAIVGASSDTKKIGNIVIRNLVDAGFSGQVFPVNLKSETINNFKCYKSIAEIPEIPELTIISIPSDGVLEVVENAAKINCKNFVVFSAGFKEMGNEGAILENKLGDLSQKYNLNILGPNCLGFFNNVGHVNATFAKSSNKPGNVKFVSQSGAIAAAVFDWAEHHNLGFSEFITLGNKVDINENDVLEYFLANSKPDDYAPVCLYLESISDGTKFLQLISQLVNKSPVFILKPGKYDAAKKAMLSHTGSLAGSDDVLSAALDEHGVIRCDGLEEMFDLVRAVSWQQAPKGPNVAIVSNAGGPAVISADLVTEWQLSLATLSEPTQKTLQQSLPRHASIINPIDVLGDAMSDRYKVALEEVLKEPNVDCVLVILTPQVMTEINETASVISDLARIYNKTIVCTFIGGGKTVEGAKILSANKIPSYSYPERAIRVLSNMWKWQKWVNRPVSQLTTFVSHDVVSTEIVKQTQEIIQNSPNKVLELLDVNKIFNMWGIPTPQVYEVSTIEEAEKYANELGYPLVLKLSSSMVVHKTEQKAVYVNLNDSSALKTAFDSLKLLANSYDDSKILTQQQVQEGIECVVGVKKDTTFGNVMLFGAGGKYVELWEDRNLAILPITQEKALNLIKNSKIYKVLKGYRNEKNYNIDELAKILVSLSSLVEHMPQINEIEINPVILTSSNVFAVDGRAIKAN